MTPKTAPLFRLLVLPLLCLALAAPSARAQVEGPPTFIDYQGMVFDGTNIEKPLGSYETTGSYTANPTNYTMEFRNSIEPTGVDIPVRIVEYAVQVGEGRQAWSAVTAVANGAAQ